MSDNLLVTDYNINDINDTAFDVSSERFGRIPSRFLSFSGKNRVFLTEKTEKISKKVKKHLPLTGYPSSNFLGGFDGGLEVGWYGEWSKDSFTALCSRFDKCKDSADKQDYLNSYCRVGSYVVQLAPTGAVVGRLKYKYVVLYHGLRLYIHSNPSGNIQPIRVKIGAVPLMRHGLQKVYQLIIDLIFSLGFQPTEELVSRADLQVMTDKYSVQDFLDSLAGGRFVTLSRGKMSCVASLSTGKLESVTVNSRNVELCVYDKLAELVHCDSSYQETFFSVYGDNNGNLPELLTRFEFRFRSEILRNFGIRTVSELADCSASLVRWASSEWFRVLSRSKIRGMEKRIPISSLWSAVQSLFHRVFSAFGLSSVQRVKKSSLPANERAVRLVRQAVGCLGSAVALVADTFNNAKNDFYSLAVGLLDKNFVQLRTKVHNRAVELALVDGFYNKE